MVVMEMNMMAFFGRAATVERAKRGDKWQETDSDSGSAAIMVGWTRDDHFWRRGSVQGRRRETTPDARMTRLIRSSCDTACIVSGR